MRASMSMSRSVCWIGDGPGEGEKRRKKYGFRGAFIYIIFCSKALNHKNQTRRSRMKREDFFFSGVCFDICSI